MLSVLRAVSGFPFRPINIGSIFPVFFLLSMCQARQSIQLIRSAVRFCFLPSTSDVFCFLSIVPGILGGGAAGVREGIAKAPNRRSRVLMNSVMNHAGKKGSFYGNTFAVLGER